MATPVGYDPVVGWIPATFKILEENYGETYQANTAANIDLEVGPAADMIGTWAGVTLDIWRSQQGAYEAGFIDAAPGTNGVAEGSGLENLLTPKIGPKIAAATSKVVLPLFADAGPNVNIPGGTLVRITGETEDWIIVAPVVIPGGGTIDATFEFSSTGPKQAVAATTWTIQTPVTGWASVGPNVAAAIPGRDEETDAEYRQRYRESLDTNIVKDVRGKAGVTSTSVLEHPSNTPDAYWGQTHWVEVLVVGGDDTEIAEAIHGAQIGTQTVGTELVVIVDADYIGGQVDVRFSRPAPVLTYCEIYVTKGQGYPGDTSAEAITAREGAMIEAAAAHMATLNAGDDTSGFTLASAVDTAVKPTIPGIASLEVRIDTIDPPVNTGVLAAAIREQLVLPVINIEVFGA